MPDVAVSSTVTAEIKVWSEESLKTHLARVQKILARRGLTPAKVISQEQAFETLKAGDHYATNGGKVSLPRDIRLPYLRVLVELPAEVIRFEGHRYVAYVDRTPKGNIFTYTLGEDQEPRIADIERFRDADLRCDHCHTQRNRKTAHIFEREADGTLLLIATSCAKEFFGLDLRKALSDAIGLSAGLKIEGAEFEERLKARMFFEDYIAASLHAIRSWGYTSKKSATEAFKEGLASANVAETLWSTLQDSTHLQKCSEEFQVLFGAYSQELSQLREEVETMVAWWETFEPEAGFEQNAKTAVTGRVCRYSGLLSAATNIYLRHTWGAYRVVTPEDDRPVDLDRVPVVSHPAGPVHSTVELVVIVTRNDKLSGDFGFYQHINLRWEVEGGFAKATHFGTSKVAQGLEVGKTYRITAKVKENESFKGTVSSLLKNLKVLETLP